MDTPRGRRCTSEGDDRTALKIVSAHGRADDGYNITLSVEFVSGVLYVNAVQVDIVLTLILVTPE
jgi:hypothetical protein